MRQIMVLGIGCPKCEALVANARQAAAELGLDASVELVSDMDVITPYEVLMLPALVVDGQVKMVGRLATAEEVKKWLR
jgi:small redox-active disulfide protein 2